MHYNIYDETLVLLHDYGIENVRFHIDLRKRSMKVGKRWVIKDGVPVHDDYEWGVTIPTDPADIEAMLVSLYESYRHSKEDKASALFPEHYFTALPYAELTDADRLYGGNRSEERFKLEYTLLVGIITAAITPQSLLMTDRQYFWCPPNHPNSNLRIYREWL